MARTIIQILVIFLAFGTQDPTLANRLPTQPPSDQLALLIGINDYRQSGLHSLKGCLGDVKIFGNILVNKFGFAPEEIVTLTDSNATKANIFQQFRSHLIEKAEPGATVVLFFSGHGSIQKDANGDEEDGLDETLVAFDSRNPGGTDILDDEIHQALLELARKTDNITMIVDACYSGHVERADELVRSVLPDQRASQNPPGKQKGKQKHHHLRFDPVTPSPAGNHVLLTACAPNERALEINTPKGTFGIFTYFLCQSLQALKGPVTYRELWDRMRVEMEIQFGHQHPQLIGRNADNYLFDSERQLPSPSVHVTLDPSGSVILTGGRITGMTKGSIYEAYSPETRSSSGDVPQTTLLRVDSVFDDHAVAIAIGQNQINGSARAIETDHQFEPRTLGVGFTGDWTGKEHRKLKAWILEREFLFEAPTSIPDLCIHQERGALQIGLKGSEANPRGMIYLSDPQFQFKVETQLQFWATWFDIFKMKNPNPRVSVDMELLPVADRGSYLPGFQEDHTIQQGSDFMIRVGNKGSQDLFIHVLDLGINGDISVIYPEKDGGKEVIRAGGYWRKIATAVLPEDCEETLDVLVVVVTTNPDLDLRNWEGNPWDGRSRGSIGSYLIQSLGNKYTSDQIPLTLSNWEIIKRTIRIRS